MNRHGTMTFDALAGLFLLAAMAAALAAAFNLRSRNAQHLLDQRIANAMAQEALASLQAGAGNIDAEAITLNYTGQRMESKEWVEVMAIRGGRRGQITGLVPATQPGATP